MMPRSAGVFNLSGRHAVVHLAIGGALLLGGTRPSAARITAAVVGWTYLTVGIIGFFATGQAWNILSLNVWDNWLHIGTAVLALMAVSSRTGVSVPRPEPSTDANVSAS